MKYIYTFFIFLISYASVACDICGCNNGGTFFGILPQSHMQFMGLRYKSVNFDSHVNSQLLKTTEQFRTTELWGRFYPLKRTQILFFAPFHQNSQERLGDGFTSKKSGLGDISVLMHYNLINTFTDTLKIREINHSLLVGFGIKAATGKYHYDMYDVSDVANANFQIGTGSWDFPLNVIYTIKRKSSGLNFNLTYKINGTNSNGYKFANQSRLSVSAFKSIYLGNVNIMPSIGLFGEYKLHDKVDGVRNELTGGYSSLLNLAVDVYAGKFAFGISGQLPAAQKLSGGELVLKRGFNLNISRMF